MRRITVIFLLLCCALPGLVTNGAAAGMKCALQACIGAANVTGSPEMALGHQVFTLQAAHLYFPSEWAAVIAGFSFGIPNGYEHKDDSGTDEVKARSSYLDGLFGMYKTFSDGGFVYLGAGITVGWGGFEITGHDEPTREWDLEMGVGFVCGAGLALPITDRFMGLINVRQRFINNELETEYGERRTYGMSSGGTEMAVGIAWIFGG